ncbi:hypothetical protein [Bacillus sp. D386]|uniref:hypothetical protein n=1 Tax=Bacillus sp. D386 TaxID=2587155 RepID=UPI0011202F35|nr:hypothetical protein [Bacillus sp. D386]
MRNFFMGMLIFVLLLITGCSNNTGKENEANANEFPPHMKGEVIINGIEYQLEKGNYKWKRINGEEEEMVETDHASPYRMADSIESIKVKSKQKATIQIDDNPDIKIYLWNEKGRGQEIEHKNKQFYIPASKGRYIYEVLAEWNDGTISYTFVLEID